MDIVRRLTSEAPDVQGFREIKPTLLVSWWCTIYAIVIILFRFAGRYARAERVFVEDGIMLAALLPISIRQAFVHLVLLHGTNNTKIDGLSTESIREREIGSQMVLISRILYAASLWAIKYSTSEFLRTLTDSVWQRSHQRYLRIFLAVTFLGTVVSDLAPCQPFTHYWQVVPDPGPQCRNGYAFLFTTGLLSIVTNLTLIIFPIPMILKSRLPRARRLSILIRLSLPLLSIAVTVYSLVHIPQKGGLQQYRSLLASLDILLATFTSNALVLISLIQDRGYKKVKYRAPPRDSDGRSTRTPTCRSSGSVRHSSRWVSDDDLMNDTSKEEDPGAGFVLDAYPQKVEPGDSRSSAERSAARERRAGVILEQPLRAKLQEIRVNVAPADPATDPEDWVDPDWTITGCKPRGLDALVSDVGSPLEGRRRGRASLLYL
ncbi:integral membrane protein, putative [Drepanopeziza brunnea f. sp. 'multigermtubi' MB_m1]|uniref:Integral membrane protein, putative n=1 Tax=Marssonina brunnea f. sp. multigermtubi (strain MB_m1) TaxID=1072389 RepID=K1WNZ6_MARBU|nr:integral membrane protein, putative [Drepanopeziza brunnea f. sp. 'multigermtubi' MB_m1]EKD14062.1 integral membrane protein, putative [Drepanopeziza brunnea f. sp. 'multigermtubi' MB_m1]